MGDSKANEYVAECFWPGVRDRDLGVLDEHVVLATSQLSAAGEDVRYLGSLLMREDEVVLCRFAGSQTAVRRAAERAAIPFERILEADHSPWSIS